MKKLKVICFLRDLNLSIDSISQLFDEENPEVVISLLLDQQEKEIKKELAERQDQLRKITELKAGMKNVGGILSMESISDMFNRPLDEKIVIRP